MAIWNECGFLSGSPNRHELNSYRLPNRQELCRVHKPGVPHGPASQRRLSLVDDVVNDAQLLGQPKYLTTGQRGDPISDRKAWPRRNGARFRLRPASPTGRPGRGETTLASDSDPRLRPGMHRTSTYSSSLTGAVGADWETTKWGRPLGKDPKNQAEQVRQGVEVKPQYRGPYPAHLQDSIVESYQKGTL